MGTLDELFEVLTLKQTGKVQPDLPVVLFGKAFWKAIINWEVPVGVLGWGIMGSWVWYHTPTHINIHTRLNPPK